MVTFCCLLLATSGWNIFVRGESTVTERRVALRHFRIGTIQIPPFIVIDRNETASITDVRGYVSEIVQWLAVKHGFTFSYVEPPDGAYGAIVNGSWNGLIGMVVSGEIDLAATALSVTYARSLAIDFSFYFSDDPMSLLIPSPQLDSTISGIIKPFRPEVWLGILVSFVVVSIIMWMIYQYEWRNMPYSFYGKTINPIRCCWILLRAILNSTDVISLTGATRLVFAAWCLAAIVFVNSYTSCLVSYLMAPKYLPLINNAKELADSHDISIMVLKYTSTESILMTATNGTFAKLGLSLREHPENIIPSTQDVADRVFHERKAFPHEETVLRMFIYDDFKATRECRVSIAKEPLYPDKHAFALTKHSLIVKTFNADIMRLGQLGLLDYWWKSALPPPNRCTASTSPLKRTSNKRLNVNYLSSVFLLYGVGVAVSFLAFVSELLFHYSKRILLFSRLELFYKNKGKHNCFSNISM